MSINYSDINEGEFYHYVEFEFFERNDDSLPAKTSINIVNNTNMVFVFYPNTSYQYTFQPCIIEPGDNEEYFSISRRSYIGKIYGHLVVLGINKPEV